jgi:predicted oxidoreductase (fatty acid repression mutant protein)
MRQAAELVQSTPVVEAAVKAAELLTDLVEEEGEATLFTFDDDSVMVVLGDQMNAYADIAAARKALGC